MNRQLSQSNHDVGSGRTININVVSTGINAYGTSTHPRPEIIQRSSCTSSSPKFEAFADVDRHRVETGLELSHINAQPTIGEDDNTNDDKTSEWPTTATSKVSALVDSNRSRLLKVIRYEAFQQRSPCPPLDSFEES